MSISIPDFSDLRGDFGPIPPGVASLFANPPPTSTTTNFPSPRRTLSPRRASTPISGSTIPYTQGANRSRSRSRSSHGSTVRSKTPPTGRGRGKGRGTGRGRGRSRSSGSSRSSSSNSRSSRRFGRLGGSRSSSSNSGNSGTTILSSGSGARRARTPPRRGRRLLLTNSPNFGPVDRTRRKGQKVTVTETRTVTTVRKGKPPRVNRVSRRQNLG